MLEGLEDLKDCMINKTLYINGTMMKLERQAEAKLQRALEVMVKVWILSEIRSHSEVFLFFVL